MNLQAPDDFNQERDILGENIIDIENTLKAINLDFIQNYNELDKNDSAETLLNEKFSSIVSSLEDEISSATGSLKSGVYDYGNGMQTKFDFTAATSHLDKHLQYVNSQTANAVHLDAVHESKFVDDKRSSTPDTGFASRDTNLSLSRRSSQKSSYSPQDSYFSPKDVNFTVNSYMSSKNEAASYALERGPERGSTKYNTCLSPSKTNLNTSHTSIYSNNLISKIPKSGGSIDQYNNSGYRKRSMSFTDNYNLKSPVLSETQERPQTQQSSLMRQQLVTESIRRTSGRKADKTIMRHSSYKPRSIRARTLRRLSYNPIVLDSSSSSAEESECDRSIVRSECDIRTRVSMSGRRHRQCLNRKIFSASQDDHGVTLTKETIYGSNASIRSAPHYNYGCVRSTSSQRYRQAYGDHQTAYDDKIYDFGGRGPGNNYSVTPVMTAVTNTLIKPPKAFAVNGAYAGSGSGSSSAASSAAPYNGSRNYVFEFDVSKLTGKSPTSNTFFNSSPEEKISSPKPPTSLPLPLPLINCAAGKASLTNHAAQTLSGFHWPEKIHASTVKQNDIMWRHQGVCQPKGGPFGSSLKVKQAYSSDSSSTNSEEFEFRRDFLPHIPPSPAP